MRRFALPRGSWHLVPRDERHARRVFEADLHQRPRRAVFIVEDLRDPTDRLDRALEVGLLTTAAGAQGQGSTWRSSKKSSDEPRFFR